MHGASDLRSHPYHAFLHQVLMPSRYIGGEFGTDTRPPAAGAATMALVFPDVYEVGMSHLGSQIRPATTAAARRARCGIKGSS